jgi:hypothetical protein
MIQWYGVFFINKCVIRVRGHVCFPSKFVIHRKAYIFRLFQNAPAILVDAVVDADDQGESLKKNVILSANVAAVAIGLLLAIALWPLFFLFLFFFLLT